MRSPGRGTSVGGPGSAPGPARTEAAASDYPGVDGAEVAHAKQGGLHAAAKSREIKGEPALAGTDDGGRPPPRPGLDHRVLCEQLGLPGQGHRLVESSGRVRVPRQRARPRHEVAVASTATKWR